MWMMSLVLLLLLSTFVFICKSTLVPSSIEIRLVGFEKEIELNSLQLYLDALSNVDVELLPHLSLAISYKVRHYLLPLPTSTSENEVLQKGDEFDEYVFKHHEYFQGFVIYIIKGHLKRKAYGSDPLGEEYCSTQFWSSTRDRYCWIDLSAIDPPSNYGPLLNGEGFAAFGQSVPRTEDSTKFSFHSQIAALCHRAALFVGFSSPDRSIPFISPFDYSLVRTFLITSSKTENEEELKKRLEKSLLTPLRLASKYFNVTHEVVILSLDSCPICAAAHELSIRVTERTDELDSKKLREILTKKFSSTSDIATQEGNSVFNMFIFKTDFGPFAFEGSKQAVSYNDCVLSIEGTSNEITIPTNFQCQGTAITSVSSDVSRHVLASAIRALFGVSATHERYSKGLGRFTNEYLFSVGHTPFGPFSHSTELSESLMDSCWRNPILSHLSHSLSILKKIRLDIGDTFFPTRNELLLQVETATEEARRAGIYIGLYDVEHAKEFTFECRRHALKAQEMYQNLTIVIECTETDDFISGESFTHFAFLPFLLVICAIIYETRISKIRSFIVRDPKQSVQNDAFVRPTKKMGKKTD